MNILRHIVQISMLEWLEPHDSQDTEVNPFFFKYMQSMCGKKGIISLSIDHFDDENKYLEISAAIRKYMQH